MPILVKWKWRDQTKTFLVIFYFFDDYSKTNLRIQKIPEEWQEIYPQKETCMSWAPSHIELGLLSELLRYANIVDGLNDSKKRELRVKLEGQSPKDVFDVELRQEYIDYLKGLLKPHLKD